MQGFDHSTPLQLCFANSPVVKEEPVLEPTSDEEVDELAVSEEGGSQSPPHDEEGHSTKRRKYNRRPRPESVLLHRVVRRILIVCTVQTRRRNLRPLTYDSPTFIETAEAKKDKLSERPLELSVYYGRRWIQSPKRSVPSSRSSDVD